MEAPDFWDDDEKSQSFIKEMKNLKGTVNGFNQVNGLYEDAKTLLEIGYEENDESVIPEAQEFFRRIL